jgi:hypothetical protein
MARTQRRNAPKRKIDFNDEDAVLVEMAEALKVDPDDLTIKESHLGDFGAGTIYQIELGDQEWHVARDEDQAHELAIAMVTQMLEEEPENFVSSFIESHIDIEHLRKELHSDVYDMRFDDADELASRRPDEFWEAYESEGFTAPDEDEEGDRPEPTNAQIDELAERQTDDALKDPMQYMEDIYGDEAVKRAIEIAGIDIKAAADEAVSVDGEGHFLNTYNGHIHDTPNGLVYWRVN